MSKWSNWIDILSVKGTKEPYRWAGVYKIRLVDSGEHPVGIARFLDKDRDGIVAIGESVEVARRLGEFYRRYEGHSSSHPGAERLFLIRNRTKFGKGVYNDCKIQFSARKLSNKAEAQEEEARLLASYFKKCGELPPLNSIMPNKSLKLLTYLSVQGGSS